MTKSWQVYARYILDTIERIERIRKRGDVSGDEILYDASLRNLQTLSETTQQLPDTLKQQYPAIPWKQISGFRNILVHNYLGEIDAQTVDSILRKNLPPLKTVVAEMLLADNDSTL